MNNTIFIGTYQHLVDEKNRFFLPAKLRKGITGFIITPGIDKCIYLYPVKIWRGIVNKFDNLSVNDKTQERAFKRIFLSNAIEVKNDIQGRIIIPQILKKQAEIKKEIVIIGVWNRLEIWSKENWKNYYNKSKKVFKKITTKLEI